MWNQKTRALQNSATSKKSRSSKLVSQERNRIKVIWSICIRNTNICLLCFQYICFPNLSNVAYGLLTGFFQSQLHLNEAVSVGIMKLVFISSLNHAVNSSLLLCARQNIPSNAASITRTCNPSPNEGILGIYDINV